ncbi:MAG: MerR family transcriptional regulator, partial [Sphingomonadaceae bacterium]
MNRHKQQSVDSPDDLPRPAFRSGAVARMAGMPVATLRIWEQRYGAVQPSTAPSGHRLYSSADVQRVMLLRQLSEQGHAIGAIASLETAQLRDIAAQFGEPQAERRAAQPAVLKMLVVGQALAVRLLRPAVTQRLARPFKLVAAVESLAEASLAASGAGCDLLVWQVPGLLSEVPIEIKAAQIAWPTTRLVVVYRFAGASARAVFADAGITVLREPQEDAELGTWLAGLQAELVPAPAPAPASSDPAVHSLIAPRRYDDAALTAIMGMAPALACECPRHIAELLLQLANFETYSAGCATDSPADAALHASLQRVAAASRTMFETALQSVAQHA